MLVRATAGCAAFACWLAWAGCSLLIDPEANTCAGGGACSQAAQAGPSGTAASAEPMAGPNACSDACESPQPVCDAVQRECVECLRDADCAGQGEAVLCDLDLHRCVQCESARDCATVPNLPRCDLNSKACVQCLSHADCAYACEPMTHTCVGCVDDGDCKDPKAARCDTQSRTCVGCNKDADCSHVAGLNVCDAMSARCVECTAQTEATCGDRVCDLRLHICAQRLRAMRELCAACEFDSDCPSGDKAIGMRDARCVALNFKGKPHGKYCLRRVRNGCRSPYTTPTDLIMSTSGATPEAYCGIDQSVTTCEAVRAASARTPCTAGRDADCGAATLEDGLCTAVEGVANRCSYRCMNAMQCPDMLRCTDNHCQ